MVTPARRCPVAFVRTSGGQISIQDEITARRLETGGLGRIVACFPTELAAQTLILDLQMISQIARVQSANLARSVDGLLEAGREDLANRVEAGRRAFLAIAEEADAVLTELV